VDLFYTRVKFKAGRKRFKLEVTIQQGPSDREMLKSRVTTARWRG